MIESPPKISEANEQESIKLLVNPMYGDLFAKIDDGYYYWDKVKYSSFGHSARSALAGCKV